MQPIARDVRSGSGTHRAGSGWQRLLEKATRNRIQLGEITLDQAIADGDVRLDVKKEAVGEFIAMLDGFDFWFNIVTP